MPHAKLKGACRMKCRYIEPVEEVLGKTTALNCVNMSRSSSVRSTCSISTLSPRVCGGVSITAGVRIISAAILRLAPQINFQVLSATPGTAEVVSQSTGQVFAGSLIQMDLTAGLFQRGRAKNGLSRCGEPGR